MRSEEFQRLAALFEQARDLSATDRVDLLDAETASAPELRAEVERLLALHETEDHALGDLGAASRALIEDVASDTSWLDRVGPYRIVHELGAGGMGVVYLAEQEKPLRRQVALKILRPGLNSRDIVARFERERQTLARLVHPGIAQVYDAGTTSDGRPYFALEYVDGMPVTDYCDARRLHTAERITIFREVCRAVEHAHQKGIIHRDLKPSNVLVTEVGGKSLPKVIDFGIARAADAAEGEQTLLTEHGHLIGTPAYMSPEQAAHGSHDLDTRTDVYSLGVILYQLLVGALPFDEDTLRGAGLLEIHRILAEEEPERPSVRLGRLGPQSTVEADRRRLDVSGLVRRLRGDLDWITMKALEKDRTRRYGSTGALAQDLGRFLANEPVEARPPSAAYRFRKFVRRHRVPVLASVLLFLTLIAGLVGSTVLGLRAERQRLLAESRLQTVERRADLQISAQLAAEAEQLWPLLPARVNAMQAWLARADGLLARRPRYQTRRDALRAGARVLPGGGAEQVHAALEDLRQEYRAKRRDLVKYRPATWMPVDAETGGLPLASYFRHEFDVATASASGTCAYRIHFFDGAVLYLNGEEIGRWNLPDGEIRGDTAATATYPPWSLHGTFPASRLRAGRNVLAAEVHLESREKNRVQLVFDATDASGGVLVEGDAVWAYAPPGVRPPSAWTSAAHQPDWPVGPLPIGYSKSRELPEAIRLRIEHTEKELARLEGQMEPLERELARGRRWVFASLAAQEEHDELDALVRALATLERDDPPGLLLDVRARLERASTIHAQTVSSRRDAWRNAAAEVAASPVYGGLGLSPQVGLVPLGLDRRSGFLEFAHLQTGDVPLRGEDGTLEFTEETGLVFVLVPGGRCRMGADDPMAQRSERPVHEVALSPYFLSKYEMTQGQWLRLVGANPSTWPVGSKAAASPHHVTLRNPVESIAWEPCRRALARVGLVLPTEAQWEYAVRAGTTTPWWSGETADEIEGSLDIADLSVVRSGETWSGKASRELDDGYVVHAPVGTFLPNPWGFHETLGNVREWCLDRFGSYESAFRPGDGLRLEFYDPELIVTRGASYSGRLTASRVARRGRTKAQIAETWVGVRPARALDP